MSDVEMPYDALVLYGSAEVAPGGEANPNSVSLANPHGLPMEILEVRLPNSGTVIANSGGTTDFTLTRLSDGGTVLAVSNVAAPFEYHPRRAVHSDTGGTTAYATGVGPVVDAGGGIPIDDHLQVVWAQGSAAGGTANLWIHIRES